MSRGARRLSGTSPWRGRSGPGHPTLAQKLLDQTYHFSEELGAKIGAIPGVKVAENVRFAVIPYRDDTAALMAYQMKAFMDRAGYAVDEGNEKVAREKMPRMPAPEFYQPPAPLATGTKPSVIRLGPFDHSAVAKIAAAAAAFANPPNAEERKPI